MNELGYRSRHQKIVLGKRFYKWVANDTVIEKISKFLDFPNTIMSRPANRDHELGSRYRKIVLSKIFEKTSKFS